MRWMMLVLLLLTGIYARFSWAVERITVEALFPGRAMVSVDGTRRLLKHNKPSPEG